MTDLEARVRIVENEQSSHRTTLKHINKTLDDLRSLMQTSVELQQRQIAHGESIERAFDAIKRTEERVEGLESYADRVKGALWATNLGWLVAVAIVSIWLSAT